MKKIQKRCKLINVTQRDIDLGEPKSCRSCPVARAIARSFKKKVGYVGVNNYEFIMRSGRLIRTPKSVEHFVAAFDRDIDVGPFTFTLEY